MTKVMRPSVDIKMLVLMDCLSLPKGYVHVQNNEKNMHKIRGHCPQQLSPLPWGYIYIYEIKQNIILNNEAKGNFLEFVQNDGNNKSFKMLPELVPSGCMSMPWGFFQMMTLCWSWPFLWQGHLFPDASVWVTDYTALSVMYFQVCSNSTYPQHSDERYRTNGPLVVDNMKEDGDGVLLGKLRKLQKVVHVLCALCALGFKNYGKVRKLERYITQCSLPVWVLTSWHTEYE